MNPELSIVILNWNVAKLLAECLRALPPAAGGWWGRCEALVVDNASSDGSVEMVRRDFPGVQLRALSRNMGFSGGNNVGIRAAQGRYILLLNPDTVPLPGSIDRLASFMAAHPEVGIVGPRLLNPDGTLQSSRRRFPSLGLALVESTPLQKWLGKLSVLRRFYMLDVPEGRTQPVDWLSGAALLCRREALSQAGLFDPGYFMFSEETDLCRRVKGAGWRVFYLPQAEIVHYGGQSTGQDVPARHINFNTGKVRYFRLHSGPLAGNLIRLYLLTVYLVQAMVEAGKWLLGHKRRLRAQRIVAYLQLLKGGLREHRPAHHARVLLVTGEYPPAQGGVGDYTCLLNQALHERAWPTRVLTRSGFSVQAAEPDGTPGLGPLTAPSITLQAALRALKATGAQVAHVQYQTGAYEMRPTINLLPWLLGRKWGGATVVTFHDLRAPYLFPKAGPLRDWANRLMARSASAVIVTNPEDAARLLEWGMRRVELIPIGSNIRNDPPAGYNRRRWRERWGADEGTVLMAYFGFLNSSKGLDSLLRALRALREKGDFRLLMVGGGLGSSDPTNRRTAAELSRLADELGVSGSLIWTGYLSPQEVSAALLSGDMAVLPYTDGASFRRGSLLAVLEHGLPLVTTLPSGDAVHKPGWPKLVDGENALLVKACDTEGLAEAVWRLAGDGELRARLTGGSLELARFFSWQRIAEHHLSLYRMLLKP